MDYKLIRSRRRTVGIEINEEGALIVRAPDILKGHEIDQIVSKKKQWILNKQEEMKKRNLQRCSLQFNHGESFLVWGEWKPLDVVVNPKRHLMEAILNEDCIKIRVPVEKPDLIQEVLEGLYRSMIKEFLEACVAHYQPCFSKKVNRITIKNQKSRWGSCSSKNNLNFNWRLSMAPKAVAEYVVVHELCHLVYMNHSRDFWDLVESLVPNYKDCRNWLKEHGHKLYWSSR